MEQSLPFPMEFRKVNTVSFGDKLKKWIHEKTPGGRMEKYKARYQELLDQTSGAERYVLMQALDRDAKKHAWGTFTRDVVVVVGSLGLIVYGGRRLKKEGWNVKAAGKSILDDVKKIGKYPKTVWEGFAKSTGDKFGEGLSQRVATEIPNIIQSASGEAAILGEKFAESAVGGVKDKLGASVNEALAKFHRGLFIKAADVLEWLANFGKRR